MAHDEQWLTPRLQTAATLCNQTPAATESPLWLGWIWAPAMWCRWLSTATVSQWRYASTGPMWFATASSGISSALSPLFVAISTRSSSNSVVVLAMRRLHFLGTDPRISINVLESAGLEVSHVLDEPTAVADLLQLDNAGVVDIGGGTTGIAIVKKGKVTYSADEATGGHHISLTLAGNRRISLEEAEQYKRGHGEEIWPAVKPVYEKWRTLSPGILKGRALLIYGWRAALVCNRAWRNCFANNSRRYRCIYRSTVCL